MFSHECDVKLSAAFLFVQYVLDDFAIERLSDLVCFYYFINFWRSPLMVNLLPLSVAFHLGLQCLSTFIGTLSIHGLF